MSTAIDSQAKLTAGAAGTATIFLDAKTIKEIATKILPCASTNTEYQEILTCLNFKVDAKDSKKLCATDTLHVCATDGSRLAHGTYQASGIFDSFNYNLPASEFSKLAKLKARELQFGAYIIVDVKHGRFEIKLHNMTTVTTGQMLMSDFPRYSELFPVEYEERLVIVGEKSAMRFGSHSPVQRLVEAAKQIERAGYVPETARDNAKHGLITLNFEQTENHKITCDVSMNHEFFSYKRSVLVNDNQYLLDRIKVTFCAAYLVDALKHDSQVLMDYISELKPIVFSYHGSTVRHLLMPVQVR